MSAQNRVHGSSLKSEGRGQKAEVICERFRPSEDARKNIFVLVCLANQQGIDLDQAWKGLLEKLYVRDKDRWKP